jgi:hypothetical protein
MDAEISVLTVSIKIKCACPEGVTEPARHAPSISSVSWNSLDHGRGWRPRGPLRLSTYHSGAPKIECFFSSYPNCVPDCRSIFAYEIQATVCDIYDNRSWSIWAGISDGGTQQAAIELGKIDRGNSVVAVSDLAITLLGYIEI